jgi:ketosteroid isomerase-like protein
MRERNEKEVWAFVQEMNRVWTVDGQPERLVDYFAPEMVAITPTDRFRREGRKACVAGWSDFVAATKICRWAESNPLVLFLADGQAAVVAYDFDIDYEIGGRLVSMRGRDLLTLERRQDRWWLVADHFSPTPS